MTEQTFLAIYQFVRSSSAALMAFPPAERNTIAYNVLTGHDTRISAPNDLTKEIRSKCDDAQFVCDVLVTIDAALYDA